MPECPKCRSAMTEGYLFSPDTGGRVKWLDGEPGFWTAMVNAFKMKSVELSARRCTQCGFVEFYADPQTRPVKTLKSIDEENERLRNLVTRLQDRVSTQEVIATDPAERTAREIEVLRELPDAQPSDDDTR